MLRRLAAALAFLALPLQAVAQVCPPVSVVDLYREAQASGVDYVVLHGNMGLSQPLRAEGPTTIRLPSAFGGKALTQGGFTADWVSALHLVHVCTPDGSLCGELPHGRDVLLFASISTELGGGYVVQVGPCGRWARADPTPEELAALTACAQGACP